MKKIHINKITVDKDEIMKAKIDSLLCNSNTTLCNISYSIDDSKEVYNISLKVVGDVNIHYKNDIYRYADDYPDELIEIIKRGVIDSTPEVELWENNWIEVIGDDVMSALGSDTADGTFDSTLDVVKLLIAELMDLYNIKLKDISFTTNTWDFI